MRLLLLTPASSPADVSPALAFLTHDLLVRPREVASLLNVDDPVAILVDARHDVQECRSLCHTLSTLNEGTPIIAIVQECALMALNLDWGVEDFFLDTASVPEIRTRLQLIVGRAQSATDGSTAGLISLGDLVVDEKTYTARIKGQPLDLAYKEFELLKYLAQNPGRVFSRSQLLQEVWGYDFVGGSRTVDVHVRRLRAKLGTEYEALIKTVRNVGYKAVAPPPA